MNQKTIDSILTAHAKWLAGDQNGKQADFRGADLRNTSLRGADLSETNFCGADLCRTDLREAHLRNVNFNNARLIVTNFCGAYLHGADFRGAHLFKADFRGASLHGANFCGANLRGADLRETYLGKTNIDNVKTSHSTAGFHLACPEEGSFIAWKKAGDKIVKLLIPADAKRSSATTLKCRASKVVVLDIEDFSGKKYNEAKSSWGTTYRIGETVYPDSFDKNRWNECSNGIHFFVSKTCAIEYC